METMTDLERETAISAAALQLQTAKTMLDKRVAFEQLRSLIAGRSAEVISRLEQERGLVREIRTVKAA